MTVELHVNLHINSHTKKHSAKYEIFVSCTNSSFFHVHCHTKEEKPGIGALDPAMLLMIM